MSDPRNWWKMALILGLGMIVLGIFVLRTAIPTNDAAGMFWGFGAIGAGVFGWWVAFQRPPAAPPPSGEGR